MVKVFVKNKFDMGDAFIILLIVGGAVGALFYFDVIDFPNKHFPESLSDARNLFTCVDSDVNCEFEQSDGTEIMFCGSQNQNSFYMALELPFTEEVYVENCDDVPGFFLQSDISYTKDKDIFRGIDTYSYRGDSNNILLCKGNVLIVFEAPNLAEFKDELKDGKPWDCQSTSTTGNTQTLSIFSS